MAVTSMMQRLLDNALTAKFAKSLKHSDLPEDWADNPEIVQLAEDAYSVMGTESPWFKAWFGDYSPGKAYKFATEGEPVASITGREFQNDGTPLTDRVVQYYKDEYGGGVERPGLGYVKLNKNAVKDDTFHKVGPLKSAGFSSVPEVIKKGEFFTKDYNWKGRGYDTSAYIAPIDINGERFAEEVILKHKPNSTSLYQHEIEPIKKLEDAYQNAFSEQMPDVAVSTPLDGAASRDTRLILPKVLEKVNPVSKVVDDKGNPLRVYHGSAANNIEVFKPSKTGNLGPAIYTTPDISAAEEFARTHDGAKVYELFVNSKNPLKLSNSLEAGEEFWGKLAGKTEADSIADLHKQGYDGAWAVGRGESRWGNTAPEIAVYSPYQLKSTFNRGTFNPADPNIYKALPLAAGVTGGLLAMDAGEAEAAPAVKDFAKRYAKAVADGDKRMMYAGSLDPEVYEQAAKKDSGLQSNRVFMGPHGGEARLATGEMEPEEVGRHVENLLNSGETRVLPNFPSNNYRNNTKNMLYLNDGKDIVAPFMAGRSGDVVLRTAFEPQKDRMKFIDGLLGRPKAPISGLRNNPASAQPQGLSVVSEPSMESTIPASSNSRKAIIPLAAGGLLGFPDEAQAEQARYAQLEKEQALESPLADPVDLLLAPFGVPGLLSKAASVISEPFVSYGMDKAIGGLLDWWED